MNPRTRKLAEAALVLAVVCAFAVVIFIALKPGPLAGDRSATSPGSSDSSGSGADSGPDSGSGSGPDAGANGGSEARKAPQPGLQKFYDQRLAWEDCRGGNECADLEVPLDYSRPAGDTITVRVLRSAAEGDRIGSLVVNPGGPGASGMDYAARAGQSFGQPLIDRFDIVGFDPRGVSESAPIDCLSDDDLDTYVAQDPAPDDATEVGELEAQARAFGSGCLKLSGGVAAHASTLDAARDIDVLRAALEEPKLVYLGASYGTQLGAAYADLFPQRSGRLLLDGAVSLELSAQELAKQQAAGFETALRAYVANCVEATDSCFLGSTVDEGVARIQQFLAEVDAAPLSTDLEGRELRAGNALYGLVVPLYQRAAWSALSLGLRQAFGGDGTMLLQFSDLYTSRGSSGYDNNTIEANLAIVCSDSAERPSRAEVEASIPGFEAASPTFGAALGWAQLGCGGFPAGPAIDWAAVDGAGAPPIVVVGTSRDPATPLAWAESLANQLESGVLLTRDGDGHTAYHSGNDCIDDAVEDYLIKGTVPADGTGC